MAKNKKATSKNVFKNTPKDSLKKIQDLNVFGERISYSNSYTNDPFRYPGYQWSPSNASGNTTS